MFCGSGLKNVKKKTENQEKGLKDMNSIFPCHLRIIYTRILKHNVVYFKSTYKEEKITIGHDKRGNYIVDRSIIGPFLLPYLINEQNNIIFRDD